MKVKEGEDDDEFLITRLNHVVPALNIVNVYGGIENRMSKQEVLESWTRLKKEIRDIQERQEGLVLIGDLNRAVGDGDLGVEGNHPSVSYGGGLIRELLKEQEEEEEQEEKEQGKRYYLLNSFKETEGGPWTWTSRIDQSVKSCLDLVIISANLLPNFSRMMIDRKQEFYPKTVVRTGGKERLIRSDHL